MKLLSPLVLAFCFFTAFGQTPKPTPDPMAELIKSLERQLADIKKDEAELIEMERNVRTARREAQESTPYVPKPSSSYIPRSSYSSDYLLGYYPRYYPTSRYYRSYRYYPSYLYPRTYTPYRYYPRRYPLRSYRRY